jgi:serine protease Do
MKHVERVVKDIIDHGFVRYASLGVSLFRPTFSLAVPQDRENLMLWSDAPNSPPDYGVVIGEVEPDSPAEKARIKQFDVVMEIDGRRMYSTVDFVRSTMEKRPGDEVEIKLWSKGQSKTLKVVLGSQAP